MSSGPNFPVSLEALRIFESAARQLSFKAAASELAITPAAVSQRIRALEERLGTPLFVRLNRGLRLTQEAVTLKEGVAKGLSCIEDALVRFASANAAAETSLTISVPTSFAGRWLATRLHRFAEVAPHLRLRLDASDQLVDIAMDRYVDLAVRYGAGPYPGLRVRRLPVMGGLVAVCGPGLAARLKGTADPLAQCELLHTERPGSTPSDVRTDWHSVTDSGRPSGSAAVFSNVALALAAAAADQGIALAPPLFVIDDIERGALMPVGRDPLPDNASFWLVTRRDGPEKAAVATFMAWLLAELRSSAERYRKLGRR